MWHLSVLPADNPIEKNYKFFNDVGCSFIIKEHELVGLLKSYSCISTYFRVDQLVNCVKEASEWPS